MKRNLPKSGFMVLLSVLLAVSVTFAQTKKEERKGFESKPYSISGVSYKAPAYAPQTGKDVLINESFEASVPPTGWSVLDVDGDTYNWMTPLLTASAGWSTHTGEYCAASASYYNQTIGALTPNNYLITPQVTIPSTGTYQLKYWVNAQDADWAGEHYRVGLSTTGNAAADFTVTLLEETMTAKVAGAWYERTIDMTAYAGQTVYIAWQHYNCTDMFWLNLDDVTLMPLPTDPIAMLNFNTAEFGLVNAGQSKTLTGFQISNAGIGAVTVTSVTSTSAEFTTSIVPADVNVVPGTPYAFSVTFSPVNGGAEAATITITTNVGDLTIAVTGEGFVLPEGMIEIGNGLVVNTGLPIEMYYGYTYSQSIYLQSELNIADKRITKILWHYLKNSTTAGTAFTDEIKIYMGHTTETSMTAWIGAENLLEVYSGTIDIPATGDAWIELNLTVPFVYNNVDNLVIAVDENTPGYHTSSDEFLCHSFDGVTNMSVRYYSDGTNPDPASPPAVTATNFKLERPNVRLQFDVIPEGAAISILPTSLNFGFVQVGGSKGLPVSFMNSGASTLTITGVDLPANFTMSTPTLTLEPGVQSSPTTVYFMPTAEGPVVDTIYFVSNATAGSNALIVGGIGYPDPYIGAFPYNMGFETADVLFPPLGWTNSGTKAWSKGSEANSGSYCARATYSPVGTAILTSPYIDNNPGKKIEFWWKDDDITAKSAKRNDSKVAGYDTTYFEVSVNHGTTWNVVGFLSAADNETAYSKFSANLAAYQTDSLLIRWRDVSDGSYNAWGVGLDDIVIKDLPTNPEVVINATSFDFGTIVVGEQATSSQFTITNDGIGTLTVTNITDLSATEFTTNFVPGAVSLASGESYSFTFNYNPLAVGADNADFVITTNGGGANGGVVTVALTGNAITIPPFTGENFDALGGVFPPLGWKAINNDGDAHNWFLWDLIADDGSSYAHSDIYCAASASWWNQVVLTPDNWLVTPKFEVTAETSLFNWWVAAQDPDYPSDKYGVFISTTGSNVADFTEELFNETIASDAWTKRGVNLAEYMGEEVYMAFRHYDCSDWFVMKIDDVELTAFVNHAPEFITTPGTSANVNGNYTYNAKAVDEDNQTLTMTGVTVPSWLTLSQTGNGMCRLLGSPQVAGSYPVEIMASDGEFEVSQSWTIIVTGINDGIATMVALYPNPVKDVLTITSTSAISEVKIFDALGKAVMVENVNKAETTVDMSSLSSGIYIVNVTTVDGKVVSKRITK